MLRHLLKLTWKRKTRNLMLSLEILLAFAIVFAIAAFGLRCLQLYRMPLGFDGRDAWSVTIRTGGKSETSIPADIYDTLRRSLRELPEVREVGFAAYAPFTNSNWTTSYTSPQTGAVVKTNVLEASDGVAATLDIPMARGRWFVAADEGAPVEPIVVSRRMAAQLFPGGDALGRRVEYKQGKAMRTQQVVGIVDEFRNKGPLMAPVNFIMTRFSPHTNKSRPEVILLRVAPGTPRAFEARLLARLKQVRNDWSYEISPLPALRAMQLKEKLVPLAVVAIIAAFVLLMVAFGLFGVLWQNTTQRIPEIGLRRAIGARAGDIYRQIVAEQLLVSSFAMALGLVLLVQLPLTGAFGAGLDWSVFGSAAALSMATIYLLSLLCSLYPGWRASRLDPTQALHYE
jgi:putative ABC transport system permease protein